MADIFQEIEEDLRRDRAKQVWEKYGIYVVAAAVFIVVSVGGWRTYEWYQRQQSEAAGAKFQQSLDLSRNGKAPEAEATMADLAQTGPSGYRTIARFTLAGDISKRDSAAGAKAFDALAADASIAPGLRDMAKIRAALLLLDTASYADMAARIEPLAAADNAWRHMARELLGMSAWRAQDMTTASRWFQAALADTAVPPTVRDRVQRMVELVAAESPPSSGGG